MNPKELRLAQMDAVLQQATSHPLPPRPPAGWLRAIREALGMTSAGLAARYIEAALLWLSRQRRPKPLEESWLRRLHREMFGQSWRWAGQYRNSDKSIGGDWRQIRLQVPALLADSDRHPFPPPARLHPPVPQRQRSSRPLDR